MYVNVRKNVPIGGEEDAVNVASVKNNSCTTGAPFLEHAILILPSGVIATKLCIIDSIDKDNV